MGSANQSGPSAAVLFRTQTRRSAWCVIQDSSAPTALQSLLYASHTIGIAVCAYLADTGSHLRQEDVMKRNAKTILVG